MNEMVDLVELLETKSVPELMVLRNAVSKLIADKKRHSKVKTTETFISNEFNSNYDLIVEWVKNKQKFEYIEIKTEFNLEGTRNKFIKLINKLISDNSLPFIRTNISVMKDGKRCCSLGWRRID